MKMWIALGQNAFDITWRNSASAVLLVGLVFLAQKLLSRWLTPRLRYALSLLVLARLLLPAVPSSPLSLENLFRRQPAATVSVSAPVGSVRLREDAMPVGLAGLSAGASIGEAHLPSPPARGRSLRVWLALGWACGCLFLVTLACWRYRQWYGIISRGQPVSDPVLLGLLDNARTEMGVRRRVKLVTVGQINSPAVFGYWRVCLVLPQSATSQLSNDELNMVFLHEMAHIRHHDVLLNYLWIAVQFLHWFNPLVWLAGHRIRADRELVRDATAMSHLPASERKRYGQVLLKLMDGLSAETPVFAGAVPVVGSQQEMKRRLIMIKQQKRGGKGAWLATAVAVVALASATFTRATDSVPGPTVWTNWNNGQKIGSFFAVAGTPRETVAVGIDGLIATRNNATGVWTTQVFKGDPDFRAIVYADDHYVVVREAGMIMTSPDGLVWTGQKSPTTKNLMGLFWDGHQYLAGGDGGTILSSPNGQDWTSRDSGSGINFYSFGFSGARYVAVGNDGIRISRDSVTWTAPTTAPASVPFTACTWTGEEFLACGLGLDRNPTIYTSPDGDVWTLRDSTITASLRAATTVNGAIYVAGDSVIGKSTDGGTTWTNTFPNPGGNELFMGLTSNGEWLLAVGFNHNVWAMRSSGSADGKGR